MLRSTETGGPAVTLEREVGILTEQVKNIEKILEKSLGEIREEVASIRAANENFRNVHDMAERQRTAEIFDRINANEKHLADVDARVKVLEEIPKAKKDNPWEKLKAGVQDTLIKSLSMLIIGGLAFFAWQYLTSLTP